MKTKTNVKSGLSDTSNVTHTTGSTTVTCTWVGDNLVRTVKG